MKYIASRGSITGPHSVFLGNEASFQVEYPLFAQICSRHIGSNMRFFVKEIPHEKTLILFVMADLRKRGIWIIDDRYGC